MSTAAAPLGIDEAVAGQSQQAVELRGRLVRLTRHAALFEVHDTAFSLKLSDVFPALRIQTGGRMAYEGRAVVSGLVDAGSHILCEVRLEPDGFTVEFLSLLSHRAPASKRWAGFLHNAQLEAQARPEYKVVVADLETFLTDLRRWTEELELGEGSALGQVPESWRLDMAGSLAPQVIPALNHLFARFEAVAAALDEDSLPLHRRYVQRRLHPLVLSAPFAHRTYHKPLGYAGDYEMVNMILRDPREGGSLFAQLFNCWLLQQDSAVAHRNRIDLLTEALLTTTARAVREGRRARICNLGCGPAVEIQRFVERCAWSSRADFILADFDQMALDCARGNLEGSASRHGRRPGIQYQRRSIRGILRDADRHSSWAVGQDFDLVYCAGLFDYLPDMTCRQIMALAHRSLRPGGRFLCTNVAPRNPNRGSMELILDWHLNYRDVSRLRLLVPAGSMAERSQIRAELTGSNLFLEVAKTDAG